MQKMKTINAFSVEDFLYKFLWSSELDQTNIKDYVRVHRTVFNSDFTLQNFQVKFLDNPFGDSLHVFVYHNDNPIAIRSLWRNDINGTVSYQPCDTAVCKDFRGHGIFGQMTLNSINQVSESIIYNFPNDNSRKLYLRNGWNINNTLYKNFFFKRNFERFCSDPPIPDDYVLWFLNKIPGIFLTKRGDSYFLVKRKKPFFYMIIGKTSNNIYDSKQFKFIRLGILFFRSKRKSIFSILNKPSYIVSKNADGISIPFWKIDNF